MVLYLVSLKNIDKYVWERVFREKLIKEVVLKDYGYKKEVGSGKKDNNKNCKINNIIVYICFLFFIE